MCKKRYFHEFFLNNINNAKRTWEGINILIYKKNNNRSLRRQDNQLSFDQTEHVNILNNHFASVGRKLASNIPQCNKVFSQYLQILDCSGSFSFEAIVPAGIELELTGLPLNKSHGLYSCPTRLLKCSRQILAVPLAMLINTSVSRGIFSIQTETRKSYPCL